MGQLKSVDEATCGTRTRVQAKGGSPPNEGLQPLRILIAEDDPADAKLMEWELERAGFLVTSMVVGNRVDFLKAIRASVYDVVLADYRLPGWTGLEALELLLREGRDIPLIVVTGTLGEEAAVNCIKQGADDCVLKHHLARLPIAVKRALDSKAWREARARDLTERESLERQLRQAQKMEEMGRLVGGIAHDFNNLLTAVLGYSEIALEQLPQDSNVRHAVDQVKKAGERAASLTRQLLAFSRSQALSPQVLDLNVVVADMDTMLRHVIGEDIELITELAPYLGHVKADRSQIEQVIMNLVVNSRDAMPNGGCLHIQTEAIEVDEATAAKLIGLKPGPLALLTVSDTGCGMDAETQARIFEPFFTTKGPGKGTGLGLSTVYGVVKQSGGSISVESSPGAGTTFKVYLPCLDEKAARTEAP
jgi:two-component system, cell cycle sensor histidine kinase and response regulator CckA